MKMKTHLWGTYGTWVLFTEAVGGLAGWLTRDGTQLYSQVITKPPLSPPSIVFPIVWVILFALMGIGGDSLLRFVTNMVLFWVRRRRLHYRRIGYHYGTTVTHRKRPSAQKPRPSEKSSRPSGVRTGLHSPQRDQKRDR